MSFKLKLDKPKTVADKHQLKIARSSMKLSCLGCRILGGPNHYEAASIIHSITRQIVPIDVDCTCDRMEH